MAVLLLAEVTDGHLAMDATAKAVTAAAKLGDVTVLCAGARAADAATSANDKINVMVCGVRSRGNHLARSNVARPMVNVATGFGGIESQNPFGLRAAEFFRQHGIGTIRQWSTGGDTNRLAAVYT